MNTLASKQSAQLLRDAIDLDGYIKSGDSLAALGVATLMMTSICKLHNLLVALRDMAEEAEKRG